jgi:hypothetical protein
MAQNLTRRTLASGLLFVVGLALIVVRRRCPLKGRQVVLKVALNRAYATGLSVIVISFLVSPSCADDDVGSGGTDTQTDLSADLPADETSDRGPMNGLFTSLVTEVVLEIDYQTGSAPYSGSTIGFGPVWDIFLNQAAVAFSEAPKNLVVPTESAGWEKLTDITEGPDFTVLEILAIASRHRAESSSDTRRTYYILWLNGYFDDGSGRQNGILGVWIGGTEVIAMFKPVISSASLVTPELVEQTTLVHEFGHAIGLVNTGLPMATEHMDAEHGGHCTNPDCVMFWLVDSPDVVAFIRDHLTDSSTVLFGDECIQDMHGATTAQ